MMNTAEDEPRVDGQHLAPLREPGSDEQLSPEVREHLAEVVRNWVEHGQTGQDDGMSDQTLDPPERPQDDDAERRRREREQEADDDAGEGTPATPPASPETDEEG